LYDTAGKKPLRRTKLIKEDVTRKYSEALNGGLYWKFLMGQTGELDM